MNSLSQWGVRHLIAEDGRVGPWWEHLCGVAVLPVGVSLQVCKMMLSSWPLALACVFSLAVATWTWLLDVAVNGGPLSKNGAPPRKVCVLCALFGVVMLLMAAQAIFSGRWPWQGVPLRVPASHSVVMT